MLTKLYVLITTSTFLLLHNQFSQINCVQNLYTFVPEHCDIKNVNESLVHFYVRKCYKLSRLELYLNMSFYFLQDVPSDDFGQIKVTGYQFRSNEYRKGPIEFMMGMCTGLKLDQFDIAHLLSNSNFKCPFKKGYNYYSYKMAPNATNMPPLLPAGRWMMEFKYYYRNRYEMFTIEWYTSIEYDPLRFKH